MVSLLRAILSFQAAMKPALPISIFLRLNRRSYSLCSLSLIYMVHYDAQTIILATIGVVGLLASLTVLAYGFRRNRTGSGKYQ